MAVSRTMVVKYLADVNNYKKGMSEITQQTKQSKKEIQLWAAQNNVSANSTKYLKKELELSKLTYKNLGDQINKTKDILKTATSTYGENSTQAQKYKDKLIDLQINHSKLGNSIKDAENPLKNLQGTLNKVSSGAQKVGSFLTKYLTAPMLAAGAGAFKLALSASEYGDSLSELSKKTGMSIKSLQEWRYAATQLDFDYDSLQSSITGFTNKLRGAADGTGDTAKAFKVLQINMDNGKGGLKSINALYTESIDKLSKVKDETMRNTLASALFGKSFDEMLPLLSAGTDELQRLFKEANKNGYVLFDNTVLKLDAFNDKIGALKLRFQVVGAEIGEKFLPIIEGKLVPFIETKVIPNIDKFSVFIGDLIKRFSELDPQVQKNILILSGIGVALGPAISGLGGFTSGIGSIIGMLGRIPGAAGPAIAALKSLLFLGGGIPALVGLGITGAVVIANNFKNYTSEQQKKADFAKAQAAGNTRPLTETEKLLGGPIDTSKEAFSKMWGETLKSKPAPVMPVDYDPVKESEKQIQKSIDEQQKEFEKLYKKIFGDSGKAAKGVDALKDSLKSMTDALKQQTGTFANFVGLFDVLERKSVSGTRLLNRLKAQIKAMGEWRTSLTALEKRGVNAAFLNDLRNMGPAAVDSINALAKMSNAQLKEYTSLYDKKFAIAGDQARKSVEYSKNEQTVIDKQINVYMNGTKIVSDSKFDDALIKKLRLAGVKI